MIVLHGEPRRGDLPAAGSQHRAVHWAAIDHPVVLAHEGRRGPFAAFETRHADVAHLLRVAVAKRREYAVRGGHGRRLAALAYPVVDLDVCRLLPVRVVRSEPQRHRPAFGVVVLELAVPAVQPHQAESAAGHVDERRETVLGLCAVMMRHERGRPRLSFVSRVRDVEIVGLGEIIRGREELRDECAVRHPLDRGHVGVAQEPSGT